jgi:hypothetical protein
MHDTFTGYFREDLVFPCEDGCSIDMPVFMKRSNAKHSLDSSFAMGLTDDISGLTPDDLYSPPISTSNLCVYDSSDVHTLESTHIRVNVSVLQSFSTNYVELLQQVIDNYLQEQDIRYTHVEDGILTSPESIDESSSSYWKCNSGLLNEDFTFQSDYASFAIRMYCDECDDGNILIEWQRCRGAVRIFNQLFNNFSSVIAELIELEVNSPKFTSAQLILSSKHWGAMATAIASATTAIESCPLYNVAIEIPLTKKATFTLISPTGPAEMFSYDHIELLL